MEVRLLGRKVDRMEARQGQDGTAGNNKLVPSLSAGFNYPLEEVDKMVASNTALMDGETKEKMVSC